MSHAMPPLTDEQRAIVRALDGPVLVVAGVGSGKTRVLAERAGQALAAGHPPESLLAITFTNRAASEMRDRLADLVGETSRRVRVTTFHALCVSILRQDGKALATDPAFVVWDEQDSRAALGLAAQQLGDRLDEHQLIDAARQIGDLKRKRVYPQNWREPDEQLLPLYRAYQHVLTTANALDFDDLITQTWLLLARFAEARLAWSQRFRWIEVDEFQDTQDAEYDVIHLLARDHCNVCVFADPAQWIYRWRGVDGQKIIDRFKADFPAHRQLPLSVNFRSTPAILAAARAVLTPGSGTVGTLPPDQEPIAVYGAASEEDERAYLARRLRALHDAGLPWRGLAVLVRTNTRLAALAEAFHAAEIPFATVAAAELFRRPEVKDLAAYLRLVANPHDSVALRRIANGPPRGLTPDYLTRTERAGAACGLLLTDLAEAATLRAGDPCTAPLAIAAARFVALDLETTGLDPTVDEPVSIAAVRVDPATGSRVTFEALVRPTRPVGSSERVHGYSDDKLAAEGRAPAEALAALLTFLGDDPIVGHNILHYDLPLLQADLDRHGLPRLENASADTLWLARRVHELDRYDLERVRTACGVAAPATHRALDDAACAADCFVHLVANLEANAAERRRLVEACRDRFAPLAEQLATWRRLSTEVALSELVESVLEESGYLLARDGDERRRETLQDLGVLMRERFDPLPAGQGLRAFLDYLSLARSGDSAGLEDDRVLLLTIHAAKGLEFEAVIVAGAHDGGLPAYWALNNTDETEEERRLLYVAMTRAKRHLEFSYLTRRTLPSGRVLEGHPSRFIADAPPGVFAFLDPD